MTAVFSTPFRVSVSCWFVLELGLVVRDLLGRRARLGRDRGTRLVVALSLAGSILVGVSLRRWVPGLDTPAPAAFAAAGLAVLWAGLAVRVWAVVTLGGSFSTFVQVDAGQAVVSRGPYRWVRHPSYSGLLLVALGFGLGAGQLAVPGRRRRRPAVGTAATDGDRRVRADPGAR